MHAASSLVMNAAKQLAGMPGRHAPLAAERYRIRSAHLKKDILQRKMISLDLEETLMSLSISATANPAAQMAMEKLKELRGCEVHLTHIPTPGDEAGLRRLGESHQRAQFLHQRSIPGLRATVLIHPHRTSISVSPVRLPDGIPSL